MLWLLLSLAHADGDPHNPVGATIPPAQRDILATYDAAHTSRREVDTLLPLDWVFDRVAREGLTKDRWFFTGRLAGSQAYGIGEVQALCDNTTRDTNFECARGANTAGIPVDAMASTLEVGVHRGHFSMVYVGSVNQLQIEPRDVMRPVYPQVYSTAYGMLTPLLIVADAVGYPQRVGFPKAAHLITGAYHTDDWSLRLGTTFSLRPYLFVGHEGTDLMGEVLLRKRFSDGRYARSARLGLDRHGWGNADAGMSTLLVQNIDLVDVRSLRNQTTLANLDRLEGFDLWWVELAHEDIAGVFDVHTQFALSPDPTLLDVSVGLHTQSYHRDPEVFGFRGFIGAVRLPRIPGYDASRSRGPSFGVQTHFPWGKPGFGGDVKLAYNDPSLVTRLPYSAAALHLEFAVTTP